MANKERMANAITFEKEPRVAHRHRAGGTTANPSTLLGLFNLMIKRVWDRFEHPFILLKELTYGV